MTTQPHNRTDDMDTFYSLVAEAESIECALDENEARNTLTAEESRAMSRSLRQLQDEIDAFKRSLLTSDANSNS